MQCDILSDPALKNNAPVGYGQKIYRPGKQGVTFPETRFVKYIRDKLRTEIVIFTHQADVQNITEHSQQIIPVLLIVLAKGIHNILHSIIFSLGDGNLQNTAVGIGKEGKQAGGKALLDKAAVKNIIPLSAPERIHYRQAGFKGKGSMIIGIPGIQGKQAGK
jgi:hypothetical protein